MAWSDEPTPAQIGVVGSLMHWAVSREIEASALEYLEETATRRDVADEIKRLRDLRSSNRLDEETVFDSEIWEGFKGREESNE